VLRCTQCNSPLNRRMVNSNSLTACPACKALLRVDAFPALYRSFPMGQSGETLQMDKEAGCFYHPRKKAVIPCSVCGRFLCALCDVAFNGRHLCPSCLEKGKSKRKIKSLENHRTCFDTVALLIATVSILIYWITIFTAPVVIFLTLKYWKAPSSIISRSKIRFILASVIAGLQLCGWVLFFSNLIPLK
jgi:hypothetical protein